MSADSIKVIQPLILEAGGTKQADRSDTFSTALLSMYIYLNFYI